MKKLMVVLMVLSMATIANATLTFTISGPTQLATGAVGVYTVGYSLSPGWGILSTDHDITGTLGTIGGGVILTTNRDTALDFISISPVSGNYQIAICNDILGTNLGSPLFSFQFTAGSQTGTATLVMLDNGATYDLNWGPFTDSVMGTLNVQITPEPMSLGLLGLGGLFLRRRK